MLNSHEKQLFDRVSRSQGWGRRLADDSPLRGLPSFAHALDSARAAIETFRNGELSVRPCPRIAVDLVDSHEVGAWAFSEGGTYFIAVTKGTFGVVQFMFNRLFSLPDFLPIIGDVRKESRDAPAPPVTRNFRDFANRVAARGIDPATICPRDEDRRNLADMMAGLAMNFLLGHEFGHIQGGHVGYGGAHLGSNVMPEVYSGGSPPGKDMRKQALEVDADTFASFASLRDCLRFAEDPDLPRKPGNQAFMKMHPCPPFLVLVACIIVFRLLDPDDLSLSEDWDTLDHPPAMLRRRMIARNLKLILESSGKKDLANDIGGYLNEFVEFLEIKTIDIFGYAVDPVHADRVTGPEGQRHLDRIVETWSRIEPEVLGYSLFRDRNVHPHPGPTGP